MSTILGFRAVGSVGRPLGCVLLAAVGLAASSETAGAQAYGPPDRTAASRFMSRSGMELVDVNGDSAVSDVDLAMVLLSRLTDLYGPDLAVGDLDQDGAETYQDVVTAIARVMRGSFGKTAPDGEETIGAADLAQTAGWVSDGVLQGDLNFDGEVDAEDLYITVDRYGEEVSEYDIDHAAQFAAEYVGALVQHGTESFMVSGAAPNTHLTGVSDTWPPGHPGWWKPNHLVSISDGYEGEPPGGDHQWYASTQIPTEPHESAVSRQWPANHYWLASNDWSPPGTHDGIWSNWEPADYHEAAVSGTWPPGHTEAASETYPDDHELVSSRTWWPNHTYEDSAGRVMPPTHREMYTDNWRHQLDNSQSSWPPNHTWSMSDTWGPLHNMDVSVALPPGHLSYASNTWPGPQWTWPPGHTLTISESWGEPNPGNWPIFPPDHSWWTTFQDITDFVPRFPWSGYEQ